MLNTTQSSQYPSQAAVPTATLGEMTFLVVDPTGACSTVSVGSPQIHIGADPSCPVRIELAGIAPIHCVVFRDAQRSVIRRAADRTWLNNQAFNEAELKLGDVIRVGDFQIRVEADQRHVLQSPAPISSPVQTPQVAPSHVQQQQAPVQQPQVQPQVQQPVAPHAPQPVANQPTTPPAAQPAALTPQPVAPTPSAPVAAAAHQAQPGVPQQPVQQTPPQPFTAPAGPNTPLQQGAAAIQPTTQPQPIVPSPVPSQPVTLATAAAAIVADEIATPSPEQPPTPAPVNPVVQTSPAPVETPVANTPPAPAAAGPTAEDIQRQLDELERQRREVELQQQQLAEERARLSEQMTAPESPVANPTPAEGVNVAKTDDVTGEEQLNQVFEEIQHIRSETIDSASPAAVENAEEIASQEEDAHAEADEESYAEEAHEEESYEEEAHEEETHEEETHEEEAHEEEAYEEEAHEEEAHEEEAHEESYEEEDEEDFEEEAHTEEESFEEDFEEEAHADQDDEVDEESGLKGQVDSTEEETEEDSDDPFARLQKLAAATQADDGDDEDPFDRLQRMNDNASGGKFDPPPKDPTEPTEPEVEVEVAPAANQVEDPFEALQQKLDRAVEDPEYAAAQAQEEYDWQAEHSLADKEEDASEVDEAFEPVFDAFEPAFAEATPEPPSETPEPEATSPASDSAFEPFGFEKELPQAETTAEEVEEEKAYESATMAALARMGKSLDIDDDPTPEVSPKAPAMSATSVQTNQQPSPSGPPEDESINDYMAQLLQRVGGDGSPPPAEEAPAKGQQDPKAKAPASNRRMPKAPPSHDDAPKKPVEKLKELPPVKRHGAENTMDLAAMRELANQTNRTAIRSHARKQRKAASSARFLLSVALVLGSLIVFFLPFMPLVTRSIIGAVMLVVGSLSCLKAMKIDALGKMQDMFRRGDR